MVRVTQSGVQSSRFYTTEVLEAMMSFTPPHPSLPTLGSIPSDLAFLLSADVEVTHFLYTHEVASVKLSPLRRLWYSNGTEVTVAQCSVLA